MSDLPIVRCEAATATILVREDESVSVDPEHGGLALQLPVDVRPLLSVPVGFEEHCRALEDPV